MGRPRPRRPAIRQEMLDNSIAAYNMAVQPASMPPTSGMRRATPTWPATNRNRPKAAWPCKASLLDVAGDQTYLLLADFYERNEEYEKAIDLLAQGVHQVRNNVQPTASSAWALALAPGDLESAVDANLKVLSPSVQQRRRMRNLALLYRDLGDID